MGALPTMGRAFVKADGQQIFIKGSVKLTPEQFSNEAVSGINGLAGFKQNYQPAELEFESVARKDFDLEALQKSDDMAITLELLDGRQYSITGARLVEAVSVDTEELTIGLKFIGSKGMWL